MNDERFSCASGRSRMAAHEPLSSSSVLLRLSALWMYAEVVLLSSCLIHSCVALMSLFKR